MVFASPRLYFEKIINIVAMEQVKRIQQGQMTAPFERHKRHFYNSRALSFSLLYGDNRSLDLCAPSSIVFKSWFLGLRYLLEQGRNEREHMDIHQRFLRAKWDVADLDRNGCLTLREIQVLYSYMGLSKPTRKLKKLFKEVDRNNNKTLDFEEFCRFMDLVCRR